MHVYAAINEHDFITTSTYVRVIGVVGVVLLNSNESFRVGVMVAGVPLPIITIAPHRFLTHKYPIIITLALTFVLTLTHKHQQF